MKLLVSWSQDFGRMGSLEGLFVTTKEELEKHYGARVYYGEVLGKHSEIQGTFLEKDCTIVSEDQEKIEWLLEIILPCDKSTISGYNPIECYKDQEDKSVTSIILEDMQDTIATNAQIERAWEIIELLNPTEVCDVTVVDDLLRLTWNKPAAVYKLGFHIENAVGDYIHCILDGDRRGEVYRSKDFTKHAMYLFERYEAHR